ncbi:MAG: Na(+)-translocating NADH-quinone reductase subunit A [Cryomorphaceae bacterium]|nr:MAG: Na(+)-translocating NADH-quinone reductase subunit A [Cryomorphaceae bacterium]
MSQSFKIRKGHNIKLVGDAPKNDLGNVSSTTYAVSPLDFPGITPKLAVKAGEKVQAGDVLFFDKDRPEVKICSPVSGEVAEVKRGAKRKILQVVVLADSVITYASHGSFDLKSGDRGAAADHFAKTGVGALITSRPYGVVAGMSEEPRDIFVNGVQSGPLAGDLAYQIEGKDAEIAAAIEALALMTTGKVYVSQDADAPSIAALNHEKATALTFSGKHPKGLVGSQIAQVAPINKGDIVWTVNAIDLPVIGRAFLKGEYAPQYKVVVAGSKITKPGYATITQGANLASFIGSHVNTDNTRIIAGDVLTGTQIEATGFLSFGQSQITAIPEGNQTEFFGWVLPGFGKFSTNRAFWAWLFPNRKYDLDTNLHGEERAFVVTGEYDKFIPMDIFPQQLLRSILIGDIEKMEQLGIYEVVPEDFALAEVACTSKLPLQQIVRNGLNDLRKEMI